MAHKESVQEKHNINKKTKTGFHSSQMVQQGVTEETGAIEKFVNNLP